MKRRSGLGWFELLEGILLMGLGVYSLFKPMQSLMGLMILYGVGAVASGVGDIILYCRLEKYMGFGPTVSLISGVVSLLVGIVLMLHPGAGSWAALVLFPLWLLCRCIGRMAHLSYAKPFVGRGYFTFALIVNILGLVLGVLMLIYPKLSLVSLNLILACILLLSGVDSIGEGLSKLGAK